MAMRHGGQILADQLKIQGVTRVFQVPGESFLAALDGLRDSDIDVITCRHEGGAAMAAEAHGKLTAAPGVAFVTRGPGACNAASGLHVAMQDSTPMVLFVGQIARGHRDREAFQELDYRRFFSPLVKWVAEVEDTARLPEYIARAFRSAASGRPGPVVLALPEDMLSGSADVSDRPATPIARATVTPEAAQQVMRLLSKAKRPLVIAGGSDWSDAAEQDLQSIAASLDLPVAVSFRRQDYFDNRRAHYVGDLSVGMNPALADMLREADMLLLLGTRLGEIATAGYTLVGPDTKIAHVHPDPDLPGRVYPTDVAICAHPAEALRALSSLPPRVSPDWANWRVKARAAYENWRVPRETPGAVKLENIIEHLSETLPADAIITNGAGNYAAFLHRYFSFKRHGTQLAPTSGSMGYGLPAAIAAKLEHPGRTVICFAGDGCFQMTATELGTAMQAGAAVIVIVVNNGKYGTIRMHQEHSYPDRVSGTDLTNPNFVTLAKAYGGFGAKVTRTEDFAAAFAKAHEAETLSVIELVLDAKVLSTSTSLRAAKVTKP